MSSRVRSVELIWSSGVHARALDTFGDEAKAIHV